MNNNNLILIPARSGSTRVKNKNIRKLGGTPLLGHIISSAVASNAGRVMVSTNDDEIADCARKYGAETPFRRPAEMATAKAPSIWVILHTLQWLKENEGWQPEMIAYCPPTNPFTTSQTISEMFHILARRPEVDSIVTMTQPSTHPFRIIRRKDNGLMSVGVVSIDGKTILDIERSQDWPEVWEGSPACRMTRSDFFVNMLKQTDDVTSLSGRTYSPDNCLGHEIPYWEAFDIDDENDWSMAEILIESTIRTLDKPWLLAS